MISGFGLSAFFFSSISRLFFHGDTSTFLLVLSLGTSLPMIIGFFLVRAVPPTGHASVVTNSAEPEEIVYGRTSDIETLAVGAREGSRTPLLREQRHSLVHERSPTTPAMDYIPDAAVGVELSPTRSLSRRSHVKEVTHSKSNERDISGRALWCTAEFWILFLILSLCESSAFNQSHHMMLISASYSERNGTDVHQQCGLYGASAILCRFKPERWL